ncbi:hypothetical protein D3C76_1305450 [compost metagenome]
MVIHLAWQPVVYKIIQSVIRGLDLDISLSFCNVSGIFLFSQGKAIQSFMIPFDKILLPDAFDLCLIMSRAKDKPVFPLSSCFELQPVLKDSDRCLIPCIPAL